MVGPVSIKFRISRVLLSTETYSIGLVGNLAALNDWDISVPVAVNGRMNLVDVREGTWESQEVPVDASELGRVLDYKYVVMTNEDQMIVEIE